tara:strand:- start:1079 stop:3787 length:2709 start_codon:yes stop_codon:yes gene_type:complete
MSVQLILYPQGYEGIGNTFSNPATNVIVNGNSFNNLNLATSITSNSNPALIVSSLQPPTIPNSWYRFRKDASIVYPNEVNGNLAMQADNAFTSGVYQQLTNVTPNIFYDITIDIGTLPVGFTQGYLFIRQYSQGFFGLSQVNTTKVILSSTTQVTHQFGSSVTNPILLFEYQNATPTSEDITISRIEVQPSFGAQGSTILDDGQVICDLYEDEDIPLTLSVDEFTNAAEKVQSYSKAFNLPATKRNNKIFDQIFEITRHIDLGSYLFNPYRKTQCVLKQDGFILFKGYLRLLDIVDKEGEISYNVNLYSEVIALADSLKDLTFSDLGFTELEHDYNRDEIENSWNDSPATGITYLNASTSGFRDANSTVKYPFCDWNHQIIVGGTGNTAAVAGNPELPTLETAFRPFINIKYLIDRIFGNSPQFTYTSTFFETDDFKKLYMDFNWGADNSPVTFNLTGQLTKISDFNLTNSFNTLDFDTMAIVGGTILNANFGYSSGVFTAQEDGQVYTFNYSMNFNRGLTADTLFVQWLVNGTPVDADSSTSSLFPYSGNFTTPPLEAGDTVLCQAFSTLGLYELNGVFSAFGTTPSLVTITTSVTQTTSDSLLGTLRGELGQWEFLNGLITMFNLVTTPNVNNPNNLIIEPYVDIFINNTSVELDWTDKIDISQIKLKPLTDLKKDTIFKFVEDDDDYAFNNYKSSLSGFLYGSLEYTAPDSFDILEGTEEIIAEPFAATVVKPLMAQYPNLITPAIYSVNDDGVSEGFENSPRILYNNGKKTSSNSYFIPEANGVAAFQQTEYLEFSHLHTALAIADSLDFNFGLHQLLLPSIYPPTPNNLFNLYWLPYYNQLYNANTRIMTLKVDLNASDINTFKFNDTIFIKNRKFRVNKIDYKPNDLATVEFILIP